VPKRRSSGSTVMQRLVPQILAELEGFEEREGALLFVGATNEPWALDAAVLRPGRFDEKIYVPLPDLPARRRILELNLRERPLAPDVDLDALAEALEGYSGADVVNLCGKACAIPFIEAVERRVDRDVALDDFQAVMTQVKPSVSCKEMQRCQKFRFGD
jgi:transitional endoplasmic reticulum ATPase